MRTNRLWIAVLILVAWAIPLTTALAQRAGASATIRVGEVTGRQAVQLQDDSAAKGALVGGAIGLAAGSGRGGKTRRTRAAAGAVIGGAAGSARPKQTGMMYTVKTGDGSMVKIVSDQTEVQIGDCVAVEESGGKANIRRLPPTACEPQSKEIMSDPKIQEEMQEEASECAAVKQELLDAETDEAVERALRKMKIFCDD